jgi:hypothetical protein
VPTTVCEENLILGAHKFEGLKDQGLPKNTGWHDKADHVYLAVHHPW